MDSGRAPVIKLADPVVPRECSQRSWRVGDIVEIDHDERCFIGFSCAEGPKFGHIVGVDEAGNLLLRVLLTTAQLPQIE